MAELQSPSIAPEDDPLYEVVSHLTVALQQSFRIDGELTVERIADARRIALDLYEKNRAAKENIHA